MNINWQSIFYFTASLAMIVVLITCVWSIWLLFITSRLINNFTAKARKWNNIVDNVRYFKKNIILNVLRFLLKILDKGDQNE